MARRRHRRKHNPLGTELVPWLVGGAAIVGVVVVVNQMKSANAKAVAAGSPQPFPIPGLAQDITAGGAVATSLINAIDANSSSSPAAGSVYVTLSNGDTIFNDGSGGYLDASGAPVSADAVANAQLMYG